MIRRAGTNKITRHFTDPMEGAGILRPSRFDGLHLPIRLYILFTVRS
jgi:hypothetical protein